MLKRRELRQIKEDLENGISISRVTWEKVLESAIEGEKLHFDLMIQGMQNQPIPPLQPRYEAPNDPQRYPKHMEPSAQSYNAQGWMAKCWGRIFG